MLSSISKLVRSTLQSSVPLLRTVSTGAYLRQEKTQTEKEPDELDHLLSRYFMEGDHVRPQKLLELSENVGISLNEPRFKLTNSKIKKIMRDNPGGEK